MYCRKVSDVQRPCFIIVVSLSPESFSAIAPPARNECTPTRSGLMPDLCRLRFRTASLIVVRMFVALTCVHLLWYMSHMSLFVVPPLARMWCTRRAQALTGHVVR